MADFPHDMISVEKVKRMFVKKGFLQTFFLMTPNQSLLLLHVHNAIGLAVIGLDDNGIGYAVEQP